MTFDQVLTLGIYKKRLLMGYKEPRQELEVSNEEMIKKLALFHATAGKGKK